MEPTLTPDWIGRRIYLIRGHKVMLDRDLATLYGVPTKFLNRAVKRNLIRFPSDFMFRLTDTEIGILRCQIGTSRWGGRRYRPYVFTEHGVAMLSSVLRSDRAALVNIAIVRAFVQLREMVSAHKQLAQKLRELERKIGTHDVKIESLFDAIQRLMPPSEASPAEPKLKIGFKPPREA